MTLGKIITIEGIDGCGKETQSKELIKNLRTAGYGCTLFNFPRYHTPTGNLIKQIQDNKTLKNLSLEQITGLYAQDRFEAQEEMLFWISYHNTIVVNDRYIESNMAYQGARFFEKRKEVWQYICEVELEKLGNRPSDIVVLLDIPAEQSLLAMQKQGRKLDANEEDLDYQEKVRACYLELAQINSSYWIVFDCLDKDVKTRKPVDYLSKEIFEEVRKRLPKKELYLV